MFFSKLRFPNVYVFNRRAGIHSLAIIIVAMIHPLIEVVPAIAQEATTRSPDILLTRFVDECVLIQPGTEIFPQRFQMGGQFVSPFRLPERNVEMSKSFRISKFETTQDLYAAIMGRNPSRWTGPRNSVESMSFLDAEVFCTRLTIQLQVAGLIAANEIVRLPTEAEWEYCCRAGTNTLYSFGESPRAASDPEDATSVLNDYAWHTGNAAGNDPAVGVLKPNSWGLFDMHGYLWEFVSDEYTAAESAATSKPSTGAAVRIIRGGSWRNNASHLTSGARQPVPDHVTSDAIGFRGIIVQNTQP